MSSTLKGYWVKILGSILDNNENQWYLLFIFNSQVLNQKLNSVGGLSPVNQQPAGMFWCSAQSEHLRYSPNSCNVALEIFFSHFLFFFFVDQFYSDPFVSQVYHLFPHFVFIWYHFSFPFLTKCWPISASRGCLRWKCFAHSAVSGRWEPCPG